MADQFGGAAGGTVTDVLSQLQNLNRQMGQWVTVFTGRIVGGTFTLANATATVVTQTAVKANSVMLPFATNATAALTVRTQGLFHSANTVGASFTVSTQSGSAAGTETFEYILFTPS